MNFDKSDFEAVSVPPFRRKTDLHQKRIKIAKMNGLTLLTKRTQNVPTESGSKKVIG